MSNLTPFGRSMSATHYVSCPACAPYGASICFSTRTPVGAEGVNIEQPVIDKELERVSRKARLRNLFKRCEVGCSKGVVALTSAGVKAVQEAQSQTEAVELATLASQAWREARALGEL